MEDSSRAVEVASGTREAEARAASLANDLDEESAMVSAAAMSESHLTAALGTKWAHCVNTRLVLE
eukprot:gene15601-18496_t